MVKDQDREQQQKLKIQYLLFKHCEVGSIPAYTVHFFLFDF